MDQSGLEETHAPQLDQSRTRQLETASASPTVNVPLHQSAPPEPDFNRTMAQKDASFSATVPLPNTRTSSSTGSNPGTTLAQSPQPAQTMDLPALHSPPFSGAPATDESVSPGQDPSSVPALPEFPELKLRRGATIDDAGQQGEKVKKKNKWNLFLRMLQNQSLRMFRRAPKKASVATAT